MTKYLSILSALLCTAFLCNAQIDSTIGLTAPKNLTKDPISLSAYICTDQQGDQAKANAAYNWVTHNIAYDMEALKKFPKHHDKLPERALDKRKAVCEGYAMLFTEICRAAGLKAVSIEGYAKDWIFDNGDEMYIPRHMWSAVMINGKWQLFDPTWGAGVIEQSPGWWRKVRNKISRRKVMYSKNLKFRYKYDPQYFMQDPEEFRLKHLPADPLWQLTDTVMPLRVFEAGDSAIKVFNEQYSKPWQTNPDLTRIAGFDERQKTFEFADRAYTFNNRYIAILGLKQSNKAAAILEKAFTDTTLQVADLLIKDASETLKKSQEYIKAQKKTFPDEYNKLKKKNKTKNQVAKKYIREIKTDDKRLIAECKKYERTATNKYNQIKKKSAAAQKRKHDNYADKINDVETSKTQKKTDAAELTALKDSVTTRNATLTTLQKQVAAQQAMIERLKTENDKRLDSLGKSIVFEDSMLVQEALARLAMHDSYDDEVIQFSDQFKAMKYKKTDSLQKYYLANFDTLNNAYEKLQQMQTQVLDVYKKDLGNLEQYKKWNDKDNGLTDKYAAHVSEYMACIDMYNNDLAVYASYVKGNKKLFGKLAALSKHQLKIAEYMEHAEAKRKELEEKTIAKKQNFDMKENARQSKALKTILAKVQKIDRQLN